MATNSDLKRWYKVYGIQPGDFVRYTDMFRILCYDAEEDFHAVNLGQVKRMLQDYETVLNLENGEGTGSVQQQTWRYQDYTILGALANGFGSIAFGGARADIDAENLDRSSAEGIQSFVAGVGVHAYGLFSSAFNKDTKSYQGGSVAFGGGTKAGLSEEQFNEENSFTVDGVRYTRALSHYNCADIAENDSGVYIVNDIDERPLRYQKKQDGVVIATLSYSLEQVRDFDIVEQYQGRPYIISWSFAIATGDTTEATGRNSFAANQNTKASGIRSTAFGLRSEASGSEAFASGRNSEASGHASFAANEASKATATCASAFGFETKARGTSSFSAGQESQADDLVCVSMGYRTKALGPYSAAFCSGNTASGIYSFTANLNNKAIGQSSSAFGEVCEAKHDRSSTFGEQNRSSRNNQMVVGQFNKDDENALFIVGNGSWIYEGTRSNAFVVHKDGTVSVYVDPISDNDIFNLGYAKSKFYQKSTNIDIYGIYIDMHANNFNTVLSENLRLENTNAKESSTFCFDRIKRRINSNYYDLLFPREGATRTLATTDDVVKLYEHNVTLRVRSNDYTEICQVYYKIVSPKSTAFTLQDLLDAHQSYGSYPRFNNISGHFPGVVGYAPTGYSARSGPGSNGALLSIQLFGFENGAFVQFGKALVVEDEYANIADDETIFTGYSITDNIRNLF